MTNIRLFVKEYRTSIWFVIVSTLIFVAVSAGYCLTRPETFKATTSILERSDEEVYGGKLGLAAEADIPISLPYEDYEGYLKSRNLSSKLAERREILEAYAKFDNVKPKDLDKKELWKRIADGVSVKDPGKGIIYIDYNGPSPRIASMCANGYVDVFIDFFDNHINEDINSSIGYLEEQKKIMETKLGEVDNKVMTLRKDNKLLDIDSESRRIINDYASARVDLLESEISLMALEGAINGVEDRGDTLPQENELARDPVLSDLRKKLMALKMNYTELNNYFKEDGEELSTLRSKINEIESQITEYVDEELSLSKDIRQDQIEFMKRYVEEIEDRMYVLPSLSNTLVTLERTRAVYEKLIALLEERLAAENMNKAKRISKFVILDRADSGEAKYISRFSLIPVLAALFGAFLGLFMVYVYVKLSDMVKNF